MNRSFVTERVAKHCPQERFRQFFGHCLVGEHRRSTVTFPCLLPDLHHSAGSSFGLSSGSGDLRLALRLHDSVSIHARARRATPPASPTSWPNSSFNPRPRATGDFHGDEHHRHTTSVIELTLSREKYPTVCEELIQRRLGRRSGEGSYYTVSIEDAFRLLQNNEIEAKPLFGTGVTTIQSSELHPTSRYRLSRLLGVISPRAQLASR